MVSVNGEESTPSPKVCGDRIFVTVRVRPLNDKEIARYDVSDWECINENTIIYRNNLSASERSMYPTAYTFDRVFNNDCNTRRVYVEGAKQVALSVVNGINSSVFAYGQTSSGKTYTMSGVTDYAVGDIFDYIEKHKEREFTLKLSAMEIYNEAVRDLLTSDTTPLRLLDDPERGTVVERITEATLMDWMHFKELLSVCETQRQIGQTDLNEASSRSHQIIRLTIESSALEFLGKDKSSSLTATVNFVDLAGSERTSQTNSAGTRLKEGCHINRSLLTLGTVIRKLSKARSGHVPFRDSKLTRILQSSLGGNAKTAIICTMSPARIHVEQTRNTLLFASCAKEVSTNAQVNVVMSDKALVKQLQKEVARLQNELRSSGPASVRPDSAAILKEKDLEIEKLKKEVIDLTMQRDLAQSQIKDLFRVVGDSSPSIASENHQYPKLRVRNSWESETQISDSPIFSGLFCTDGLRSFDASHYSDGLSISGSDDYLIDLPDFEIFKTTPPRPSVHISDDVTSEVGSNVESDVRTDETEERNDGNLGDHREDVRYIESEDLSAHRFGGPNISDSSPNRYTDSNMSSPGAANTVTSVLTVVEAKDKENQDLGSPMLERNKQDSGFCQMYGVSSSVKTSPLHSESNKGSSTSLRWSRSRSCKASLMMNPSSFWFEGEENMDKTPPMFDKEFIRRHDKDLPRKVPPSKFNSNEEYNANEERLSRESSQHSPRCSSICEDKEKNTETSVDNTVTERSESVDLESECVDLESENQQEPEPEPESEAAVKRVPSAKNVRDVGVDPMPSGAESPPNWPMEFRRLQREIVDLWDACNVSLIHRTYFFLLFQGDPTDSIYMEVELRRLTYLKKTFSGGNLAEEDAGNLTPASSLKNLRKERQMLSRQMMKQLSGTERENIYIKWGIPLNGKHRRLQLAHKLWTDTATMDHVRDSANIVAKLVGNVKPEKAFKEMFGLNFAPEPTRKRSFAWTGSKRLLL